MPGHAAEPAPTPDSALSAERIRADLEAAVTALSVDIGERHAGAPEQLLDAARWIGASLEDWGLRVQRRDLVAEPPAPPVITVTIDWMGGKAIRYAACPIRSRVMGSVPPVPRAGDAPATGTAEDSAAPASEIPGTSAAPKPVPPLLIVAHYDTVPGTPGANDNASGVAVLLALAHALSDEPPLAPLTLAFVPNEEEPRFMTERSGSVQLARQLAAEKRLPRRVVAVDSMGWSGEDAGWRKILRFSPHDLTIGARPDSRALAEELARTMSGSADAEAVVHEDGAFWIDKSDHAAFAAHGVASALLTASGTLTSPCLHEACDTADELDYALMQDAVLGLAAFAHQQSPAPR